MLRFAWVVVCTLLFGCDAGFRLDVRVRTDYSPGAEFSSVRVEVQQKGSTAAAEELYDANRADPFVLGHSVASFDENRAGEYLLRVELLNPMGLPIASRTTEFSMQNDLAVLVVLTRSCRDVRCPMSPGDAATECSGGQCASLVHECKS